MDGSFRDWAWLPPLFVNMMVAKLDRVSDCVRLSSVCPQWRYVALETNARHKVNLDLWKASRGKLPMLLFNTDENNYECRSLFSVSDGKTYTVKLPLPYKKRFLGSSFGWLFCVDEDTMVITLVNPYKNSLISLPAIRDPGYFEHWYREDFDYYVEKVILSSDPHVSENSFEVAALCNNDGDVAYFKAGMPAWDFIPASSRFLCDIIFYEGKLYGVSIRKAFFEIDLQSKILKVIDTGIQNNSYAQIYLVESQHAELLVVTRRWYKWYEECLADEEDSDDEPEPQTTFEFKVFKITHPIVKGSETWVEINNIGQHALFLGENQSMCVPTTEFPGCQPNSIYYTSQLHLTFRPYTYDKEEEDSGFFNLNDGRFYKHHVLGSSDKYVQPSIWFLPSPQKLD